jgi:hypothetical protein
MKLRYPLFGAILFGVAAIGSASEPTRPDHFAGKPSPTLDAAWRNAAEADRALAAILEKPDLQSEDHTRIHELTYTLEVAYQRIETELRNLQVTLEELHLASEQADTPTVRTSGKSYLEQARRQRPPAP